MSRTPQPTARQRELSGHPAPSTEARAEPGEQHDDTNHSEPTNSSFVISARFFLSLPELNRNPATDQKHEKEKLSHTRTRPVPKQTATSVPPSTTATSRTRDRFAITAPHFLGRRIPPVPIRTSPRAVPRRPQARWQRGPTRGRPGGRGAAPPFPSRRPRRAGPGPAATSGPRRRRFRAHEVELYLAPTAELSSYLAGASASLWGLRPAAEIVRIGATPRWQFKK